jgi:hypothetical protein
MLASLGTAVFLDVKTYLKSTIVPSGTLRRVVYRKSTDVSGKHIVPTFMIEK